MMRCDEIDNRSPSPYPHVLLHAFVIILRTKAWIHVG